MRFSDTFLDDLRDRISISDVVGSRVDWDRKKTRVNRGDWWGCCPFHGESRPSFHCEDRKGRYHCFGCGASGDHFRFFMELDGVSFVRAVEMVADLAGVRVPGAREETPAEKQGRARREQQRAERYRQREESDRRERERKADTVRSIWAEGKPLAGTLGEVYLNSRSIFMDEWQPSLRYHPSLWLAPSEDHAHGGRKHPGVMGGVQSKDRKLIAIWRILLGPDGRALTDNAGKKIKLGFGPAAGGAVRLGPVGPLLRLAEGIETAFGVGKLTRGTAPVWATLSTSGMKGFDIPEGVQRLEIYADGDRHRLNKRTGEVTDPPGIIAAKELQSRAKAQGVEAVVFPSPEPDDWLDVWAARHADEQRLRHVEYRN